MRIAVLSDIHGNLMALEAAARAIESWCPDRTWFLGDAVIFGPDPAPCLDMLRDLNPEICIEGNTDRYLTEAAWSDALADESHPSHAISTALSLAHEALDADQREFVAGFRRDVETSAEGVAFHLCHGAPGDDEVRLAPDEDPAEVDRRVRAADANAILCGHTHMPWIARIGDRQLLNDGSIGYPFDGDLWGSWLALEVEAGAITGAEIRRFDFDREETIRRLESFGPLADVLMRRLRTGLQ